ncbi:adenosylcobinamide-GDP ribazoletransferase [Flavonifractor sp. An112]|uniref:adenosylcobinamide-GDP ribazoletransferase n=1 Tax=Flavonifractor sp. An112 TaxID=1965544 RepID=UPI000B3AB1FD|nr:adenosylcobinamide-GDP ribazoletransferase [Flavonifractor sp. An112]OUQ61156.1 adenosylcobinamide-GDP ribazoletransferase [Flavonifractor sp. An112]
MKSLIIAFAMYSKVPMPRVDWEKKALSWALCFFPLVGAVIGAVLYGWMALARYLGFSPLFFAAFALLIPIALSGGIHLDGFCDTCDALSSHQSRERKLEILKDSHTGAFAIICCGLYLLVFFACWSEVAASGRAALVLALGPVLSRSLSGLFAVTLPNARGTGLLATFTDTMDTAKARGVMVIWVVVCVAAMLWLDLWTGGAALLGAGLACLYYRVMSQRQFGGVTGDLAGFFLQICELGMVLMVAVVQKIEVLV